MIAFAVFCLAAAGAWLTPKLLIRGKGSRGPRLEGVTFVTVVLFATLIGLLVGSGFKPSPAVHSAITLLAITAALYVATALRGVRRLPPVIADFFVILAACLALYWGSRQVGGLRLPFTNANHSLGTWSFPLTVAWVWVLSRMTAALNRTPQVTGGYLGIVGLTFTFLLAVSPWGNGTDHFPIIASAALAGAGLASVPAALGNRGFNVGWSAALSMGFLLAQISITSWLQGMAFAILALLVLVFGLPLLDVSFYQLRAPKRDAGSDEDRHLRLHEALMHRGISPVKVALIYLALAAGLCLLGVILVLTASWNLALRLVCLAVLLFGGFVFFFSIVRVLMGRKPGEEIPENVEAFGMRISPVTMDNAVDRIDEMILTRTPHHVVTSDANAILRAQEDPEYAAIMRRAALITPDGYGVMWGARLLNLPVYERVTGVDMVTGICARAARKGYSIYILGSAPGIAATAAEKLTEQHPGLRIAGTQHGYFSADGITEDQIAAQIKNAAPDVLFVAFGIPKQEKFIAHHLEAMNVPVCLGVGGSFDVYSDKLKRAPLYIQRAGMEWLYRVWQEPWRWKRMSYVPRFMLLAIKVWLFGSGRNPTAPKSPESP